MPPEAQLGMYWGDSWSLGLVAYLMVFEGQEPIAMAEASKADFKGEWLRLGEDQRYQSAMRVAEDPARRARSRASVCAHTCAAQGCF